MIAKNEKVEFEPVRFHHAAIGSGNVTVAFQIDRKRDDPERMIKFALVFCAPSDRFVRLTGREKAGERLRARPQWLSIKVEPGAKCLSTVIKTLLDVAWKRAPRWKRHFKVWQSSTGEIHVAKHGLHFVIPNPEWQTKEPPQPHLV